MPITRNTPSRGKGSRMISVVTGWILTSTGTTPAVPKLRAQNSTCTVIYTASNAFLIVGDLA